MITVTATILWMSVAQQGHTEDDHRQGRNEYHHERHHARSSRTFVCRDVVAVSAMRLTLSLEYLFGTICVTAGLA
jgi:hypothetical protein